MSKKKPVCDSDQKLHFKTKYIYLTIFFKRCIQHLAAGAAVIFLLYFLRRCLALGLLFVREIFLIDVAKVTLTGFENKKPEINWFFPVRCHLQRWYLKVFRLRILICVYGNFKFHLGGYFSGLLSGEWEITPSKTCWDIAKRLKTGTKVKNYIFSENKNTSGSP